MNTLLRFFPFFLVPALFAFSFAVHAASKDDKKPEATPAQAEQLNVENIKEKYWARGDESELGVVQNRLFSKEKKLELSLFAGNLGSDPFLSVQNIGGSVGFHFSEYLGVHVIGWKSFAGPSSALDLLQLSVADGGLGTSANVNKPQGYVGSEIAASILYGKLSLLGKAIIHYDMHLDAGLGLTLTDNGKYLTPHLGIGQEIFLSQLLSLRVDYRLMYYREDILRIVGLNANGQLIGPRSNFTNAVMIGIGIKIPVFGKKTSEGEAAK